LPPPSAEAKAVTDSSACKITDQLARHTFTQSNTLMVHDHIKKLLKKIHKYQGR
jgi:hypothetical protein